MTEREIDVLDKACQMSGIDPSTISAENPATKSGKTAQLIMAAAGEIDPVQAAMWRKAAPGGGYSVATLAEMQSGQQLSNRAKQELWEKDPEFVAATIKQREQKFEADKKWYEDESDRMRRARYGDKAVDFQNAKAAAEQEARTESLRRHNEQQQRINQKQVQSARMAGRLN